MAKSEIQIESRVNWLCWDLTNSLLERRDRKDLQIWWIFKMSFDPKLPSLTSQKNSRFEPSALQCEEIMNCDLYEQKLFCCRVYLLLCWTINGNNFSLICVSVPHWQVKTCTSSEVYCKYKWATVERLFIALPQLKQRINSVQMLNKWFEFCCRGWC